jgi:hypothetical protein
MRLSVRKIFAVATHLEKLLCEAATVNSLSSPRHHTTTMLYGYNLIFITTACVSGMSDSRLLHSVDREIQIEVPPEVLAEVVLRTSPDANRTEIDDVLGTT